MNIEREKEHVVFYHYDTRDLEFEKEAGTPETQIKVLVHVAEEDDSFAETDTGVEVTLSAMIVSEEYVLSSSMVQLNILKDKKITNREELSQEELRELSEPLFDLLRRMTYEVTEVAIDEPGLKLEF